MVFADKHGRDVGEEDERQEQQHALDRFARPLGHEPPQAKGGQRDHSIGQQSAERCKHNRIKHQHRTQQSQFHFNQNFIPLNMHPANSTPIPTTMPT